MVQPARRGEFGSDGFDRLVGIRGSSSSTARVARSASTNGVAPLVTATRSRIRMVLRDLGSAPRTHSSEDTPADTVCRVSVHRGLASNHHPR